MFFFSLVCFLLLRPGISAPMETQPDRTLGHMLNSLKSYLSTSSFSAVTPAGVRQRRLALLADISHLELLVVVGPDVQQFHKQDTEKYILTNLNIASELLGDTTLGANMRIHLVRMIILPESEPEIQMSTNITSSLQSVCEWGRRINPPNDTDPLHADLLLYITRYDLVLPDGNKQVRGVAQLGGVCSSDWGCVITEDTGFDLGITIAHELGHSFGVDHDGVGNTCSKSGFIMASDGGYNSVDLSWSTCSRQQLLRFFSEGKAECVTDVPAVGGSLQEWKPGLYYDVDEQCRIAFGGSARACSFTNPDLPACRVLSCHVNPDDDSSCKRLLVPLLDGTQCAPSQWCLKGRCVSPDDLGTPVRVHGSWAGWSHFSPCSRTCGGGVTQRTRLCNNPRPAFGGRDCEGSNIEAELCNQQPCERTQMDFMAEQCSQTDLHPLYLVPNSPSFYTWIPALGFAKGDEQCRHMCQSKGENFIVSRGAQFIDGTRCELDSSAPFGTTAVCLRGECKLFGCDGVLHSGKEHDVCGVCGGNGSTCSLTSGSYKGGQAKEYTTFLTVPVNATHLHVLNRAPLFTHMAVMIGGHYVVAGSGKLALNITYPSPLSDGHLLYRLYLTPDLLPEFEEVFVHGPLKQEINMQIYRKYGVEYGEKTNPDIKYQFYVPNKHKNTSRLAQRGYWTPFVTPCSVTCGSGVQKHMYVCVDKNTNIHLEEQDCEGPLPASPLFTTCQLSSCPPNWIAGAYGDCSVSCGEGVRRRSVQCFQRQGADVIQVSDSECASQASPPTTEKCNQQQCPARWVVSQAGNCSAVCGPGEAKRVVTCVWPEEGVDVEVGESHCASQTKPPEFVPCVVDVCPIGWESKRQEGRHLKSAVLPHSRQASVYVWSPVIGQCSKSCGNGTKQVGFSCVDHQTRQRVPDLRCDASIKPAAKFEMCSTFPCPLLWRYKQGVCSVTCGGGIARRVLYCAGEAEGAEVVMENSSCRHLQKPPAEVPCNTHSCPARWKLRSTSPCSVSCDLGIARRNVSCVQFIQGKENVVQEESCDAAVRPATSVPCLVQVCTVRWEAKPWSKCSVTCGYGIQSRAVSCVGPSKPTPMSPLLCMTLPKPITIQGCHMSTCGDTALNITTAVIGLTPSPTLIHKETTQVDPDHSPPIETSNVTESTAPSTPVKPSACGQLLLEPAGTVDLSNVTGRCTLSIGRPLDEIIRVKVISSSLNCSKKEYLAFFDRLAFVKKCEQIAGSELTSRTNVLLVRQNLFTLRAGVVFNYISEKNEKRIHDQDCDIQLFPPSGIFENPIKMNSDHSCKVLINSPPLVKIRIQALNVGLEVNATISETSYIMIRDKDALRTSVFKGPQLFTWQSSGNMAEVEFHGDYLRTKGSFRAEYSFVHL